MLVLGQALATATLADLDVAAPACRGCNVVLITFDALRADRLGAYGHDRNTSPHLDRFASESVVFLDAASQSGSTVVSLPSLFTSRFPYTDAIMEADQPLVLREEESTIAEMLAANGYDTAAVIGHEFAQTKFGLGQGFALFDEQHAKFERGELTSGRAIAVLDRLTQPFFLWIHLRPPHAPYEPTDEVFREFYQGAPGEPTLRPGGRPIRRPMIAKLLTYYAKKEPVEEYRDWGNRRVEYTPTILRQLQAAYDGNIRRADDSFDRFLTHLDADAPRSKKTVVVVAADHAESIGEHKIFNHNQLYYGVLHTPLIVRLPDRVHADRAEPVMNVDILPTLLHVLGIALPERHPIRGRSLFVPRSDPIQFAEYEHRRTLRRGRYKILVRFGKPPLLFDVVKDPDESIDLAQSEPQITRELLTAVDEIRSTGDLEQQLLEKSRVMEKLKALGYIE